MTTARSLRQIMATTDVHSALGADGPLLGHLHQARTDSLLVDCGDFFEGTGYYRLGRGALERDILLALYDVIAPGNHGWPHYFEPSLHQRTVCANVVEDSTGNALFRRLRIVDIAGRRTAVTAVIGLQAFNSIPAGQRSGHRFTDPVHALRELMLAHHHEVDSWVLLSHSGFEQDLQLAEACPFLDVVFAGHCHSEHTGPERVGSTVVLKGQELAVGYAVAERSPKAGSDGPPVSPTPRDPSYRPSWPPSVNRSPPSTHSWPSRWDVSSRPIGTSRSTATLCSANWPTAYAADWAAKRSSSTRPPCARRCWAKSSPPEICWPSSRSTTTWSRPRSRRPSVTTPLHC